MVQYSGIERCSYISLVQSVGSRLSQYGPDPASENDVSPGDISLGCEATSATAKMTTQKIPWLEPQHRHHCQVTCLKIAQQDHAVVASALGADWERLQDALTEIRHAGAKKNNHHGCHAAGLASIMIFQVTCWRNVVMLRQAILLLPSPRLRCDVNPHTQRHLT